MLRIQGNGLAQIMAAMDQLYGEAWPEESEKVLDQLDNNYW